MYKMEQKKIDRINELAKKMKTVGLTEEEKADLLQICKESNGIYLVEKEYLKDYFDGRI